MQPARPRTGLRQHDRPRAAQRRCGEVRRQAQGAQGRGVDGRFPAQGGGTRRRGGRGGRRGRAPEEASRPGEPEGWRGEIRDGEVVVSHEEAVEREEAEEQEREDDEPEDEEFEDGAEDEGEYEDNLADILERVLDKGIVIAGDIKIDLLDIELLTIRLRLFVASVDTAKKAGIDWWETDPALSSKASRNALEDENRELRERLRALEPSAGTDQEMESEQR